MQRRQVKIEKQEFEIAVLRGFALFAPSREMIFTVGFFHQGIKLSG